MTCTTTSRIAAGGVMGLLLIVKVNSPAGTVVTNTANSEPARCKPGE